jgi:hypothetical protein
MSRPNRLGGVPDKAPPKGFEQLPEWNLVVSNDQGKVDLGKQLYCPDRLNRDVVLLARTTSLI